jgi:hypothetical protein
LRETPQEEQPGGREFSAGLRAKKLG